MRDRNLSQRQFNIQLENYISPRLQRYENGRNFFSQELSLELRPSESNSEFRVSFQKDYRSLRTLSIILWYLPERSHFLLRLELEGLSLNWLNWKQQVEIRILLNSKKSMEKYLFLTQRYTGSEIFGNILGNDLRKVSKETKFYKKIQSKAKKKIWRRGPKDKGSRRETSSLIIFEETRKDIFLQIEEEESLKRNLQIRKLVNRILEILEDFSENLGI